jgi:hypothetical protein
MRTSNVFAILTGLPVAVWLLLMLTTIGTANQLFYLYLPTLFLVVPVAVMAFNRVARPGVPPKFDELVGGLLGIAIIVNFFAFAGYVLMSGGGM